eukprot:5491981-Karenia_brevis.AAC.1
MAASYHQPTLCELRVIQKKTVYTAVAHDIGDSRVCAHVFPPSPSQRLGPDPWNFVQGLPGATYASDRHDNA